VNKIQVNGGHAMFSWGGEISWLQTKEDSKGWPESVGGAG
jgi:hypothetical protein